MVKAKKSFDIVRWGELKGRQWTVLDIAHPLQNDDISCGVYILKIVECITVKEEIAFLHMRLMNRQIIGP